MSKTRRLEVRPSDLLVTLVELKNAKEEIDRDMRRLVAYARELVFRPYTLASLAEVLDMSISGVRSFYDEQDVTESEESLKKLFPHEGDTHNV